MSKATVIFDSGTGHSIHGRLWGSLPRSDESIATANQTVLHGKHERGHGNQRRESPDAALIPRGGQVRADVFEDAQTDEAVEDAELEYELDDESCPTECIQRGMPYSSGELERHRAPVDRHRALCFGGTKGRRHVRSEERRGGKGRRDR